MSFFPVETIQVFAESIGIPHLKEDVSVALAQEVEYRIRELIQDASKFMLHSKRAKLTVEDVNNALRMKHSDPLYGYDPTEPLNFRLIPHTNIFFAPDPEIDLETFLASPIPKAPLKAHFTAHWLAIEGVQPLIPENPPPAAISAVSCSEKQAQLAAVPDTKEPTDKAILVTAKKDISLLSAQDDAEVTPCVKHVLSKEMQMFFETIIGCINSAKEEDRSCALESLKMDAGLQQLLPYFIQYAAENIARNLRNAAVLLLMIDICNALVLNNHLFIEPYLHQMLPVLLSCIVAKSIGNGGGAGAEASHWRVRKNASVVIGHICRKFSSAYQTLHVRTCKTLMRAVEEKGMPLSSHFGAFYCLAELGMDTLEAFVVPVLEAYVDALKVSERWDLEPGQREEVEAVWKLLVGIGKRYCVEGKEEYKRVIERVFGDDLYLDEV